jgi:ERCC4-type nuclease
MPCIRIVADDREARSPVLDALQRRDGIELTVRRLDLGDYLIDERLLFERKTLRDFVVSMKDGRLFEQALRLAAAPLRKAIVLEGGARALAETGMRREALQGALIALTLFLGIPLLRSADSDETARLMLYAARQYDRLTSDVPPPRLFAGKRPRGKRNVQARILQSLPGIGPSLAERLLERFGTVETVLVADENALSSVQGIGVGRAKAIRWAVSEGSKVYDV